MKNRVKIPKSNIKTIIIAGIVLFSLFLPGITNAFIGPAEGAAVGGALFQIFESIGKDILITLGQALHFILNWFLKAAASVFEGALDIGFDNNIVRVAKIGWGVTRDFANMFFILFLVIVAFATILRIEQYGIRELLPKIIIIALLINFSFVIAAVAIDFSNIAANFFIKDIRTKISGKGIISATFADSLSATGAFISFYDCDEFLKYKRDECNSLDNLITNAVKGSMPFIGPLWSPDKCMKRAGELYGECQKYGSITVEDPSFKSDVSFLSVFLSMTVGSIILLIAAFTLFAGAILLLIRIIALWLLIVIVPFAFICYIMPGLRTQWRKWWSTFLSWCFFAPAYAFFVWMAIQIATTGINKAIANITENTIGGDFSATANPFLADPGAQLIGYGIIIAFLLGGLVMARQMGIYGAKVAINVGQKWGRGAGTWIARKTTRYPKEIGAALGAAALQGTGKALKQFPGLKKFGRGLEARGKMLMRKPEESEEVKRYEKRAKAMADKDLLADVKSQIGVLGLTATKVAQERGLLKRDIDREAVEVGAKTLKAYGYIKEADELLESRVDAIRAKTDREKTMDKAIAKGIHKDWREAVLKGPEGELVVDYIAQKEPTISEVIKVLKELRKDTQQVAKATLKRTFSDDFTDAANIRRREVYAAYTGEVHLAFTDSGGNINEPALEHFVKRMKPMDFRDLELASVPHVAKYVDSSAAAEMGRHISGEMKRLFAEEFNRKDEAFKKVLKKVPGWASYIT